MTETINTTPEPASNAGQDSCGNCGVALLGPHCHACGQPVKGLVRHFSSVVGDALDTVFDFDTRIMRTIGPLFAKPGFITREYFAGRRVRYVSPVRLFFFLAIMTFFVAQVTTGDMAGDAVRVDGINDNSDIGSAKTVADVERARDAQLAALAKTKQEMVGTPASAGIGGIQAGERAVRDTAATRIKQLQEAQAKGLPPPEPIKDNFNIRFGNGERWDAEKNPIQAAWLPGFANRWLNQQVERGNQNIGRLKQHPAAFKNAVLSAIPTTLFVLVPLFALMLKLAYVFKRRLYMEHLIVALHSHAFLCLDLLLLLLVRALANWLAPDDGALASVFGFTEKLLFAWMPIYLLIMQKRVYAQGWPMTLLKYFVLGTCYTFLLSFAIVASAAIGLVAM